MPTCLELAGAQYPDQFNGRDIVPLQGESLVPAFTGRSEDRSTPLFWEHMGNRAVRKGKWKLVSKYENKSVTSWELYDMAKDRTELNDLSSEYPDKVAELAALYTEWSDNVGVVLPEQLPGSN
jgi:arylsulfatase